MQIRLKCIGPYFFVKIIKKGYQKIYEFFWDIIATQLKIEYNKKVKWR